MCEDVDTMMALIAAVQKRPALYDKNANDYSNRQYCAKQWLLISEELNLDEQDARKRWTQLRDYFQKNHRLQLGLQSHRPGCKRPFRKGKKWYLYDHLKFLIPHIIFQKTFIGPTGCSVAEDSTDFGHDTIPARSPSFGSGASNHEDDIDRDQKPIIVGSVTSTHEGDIDIDQKPIIDHDLQGDQTEWSEENEQPTLQLQAPLDHSRFRKFAKAHRKIGHRVSESSLSPAPGLASGTDMNSVGEPAKPFVPTPDLDECDEDTLYCKSLVPKMRLLDTVAKLECQIEIHSVILKHIKQAKDLPPNDTH